MKRIKWLLLPCLFVLLAAFTFPDGHPLRVVFIIGENEYHTWETLPAFADKMLKPRGILCQYVQASSQEGDNVFTNFDLIKGADLLVVSTRRRTPPIQMMKLIHEHLDAGKPLVGIRTASHAFGAVPRDAEHEGWTNFDMDVLGCKYQNHYMNAGSNGPPTVVQVLPQALGNPVLAGVDTNEFRLTSTLYKCRQLAPTATPLMAGQVEGGSEILPVAWVNTGNHHRVFYTSMGNTNDFNQPFFQQLLYNGIVWCLNEPTK